MPDGAPDLAGRTVLAVLAHPDDESLCCGATLACCSAQGARVSLLCATRGEAGERTSGISDDVALGTVRRGELDEAAQLLGIHDVMLLDHPDGSLMGEDHDVFRQEVVVAIRHFRPDVVITFGADGLYWHPDHIYVHERVSEAVRLFGPGAPALYYVVFPVGLMRRVVETAQANPGAPEGLSLWHMDADAFGAYAQEPTLTVDARRYVAAKMAALRSHRTQIGASSPFTWLTDQQAADLVGREYFVRADAGAAGATFLDSLVAADQVSSHLAADHTDL